MTCCGRLQLERINQTSKDCAGGIPVFCPCKDDAQMTGAGSLGVAGNDRVDHKWDGTGGAWPN